MNGALSFKSLDLRWIARRRILKAKREIFTEYDSLLSELAK